MGQPGSTGCATKSCGCEVSRVKPEVACAAVESLRYRGVKYRDAASDEIGPDQIAVSRPRWTRARPASAETRKRIQGEASEPGNYWIDAPSFHQSLRPRRQPRVKWKIPTTAKRDSLTKVQVESGN